MPFHYERAELDKLGEHDDCRVKFTTAHGETRWLSISPYLMGRLRAEVINETMPTKEES